VGTVIEMSGGGGIHGIEMRREGGIVESAGVSVSRHGICGFRVTRLGGSAGLIGSRPRHWC